MDYQLLTNEEMVKGLMPVSQNLAGEYLSTAMFEAQELGLQSILGQTLLARLMHYEEYGEWASHPELEGLKHNCQYYLAYKTIQEILPKVAFKICNAGAVQTSDQNVQNLSREQIDAMIEDYSSKADSFAYRLQAWLRNAIDGRVSGIKIYFKTSSGDSFILADGASFLVGSGSIVLTDDEYDEIKMNLYSAASCGIWLGGARGRI